MRALDRLSQDIEHILQEHQHLKSENIKLKKELEQCAQSKTVIQQLEEKNLKLETNISLLTRRLEALLTL